MKSYDIENAKDFFAAKAAYTTGVQVLGTPAKKKEEKSRRCEKCSASYKY